MRGEEEHLEEASGKLYTKDVVIQDCNAYIKQVNKRNFFLILNICQNMLVIRINLLKPAFTLF